MQCLRASYTKFTASNVTGEMRIQLVNCTQWYLHNLNLRDRWLQHSVKQRPTAFIFPTDYNSTPVSSVDLTCQVR
jgi:hypothetical protein